MSKSTDPEHLDHPEQLSSAENASSSDTVITSLLLSITEAFEDQADQIVFAVGGCLGLDAMCAPASRLDKKSLSSSVWTPAMAMTAGMPRCP